MVPPSVPLIKDSGHLIREWVYYEPSALLVAQNICTVLARKARVVSRLISMVRAPRQQPETPTDLVLEVSVERVPERGKRYVLYYIFYYV